MGFYDVMNDGRIAMRSSGGKAMMSDQVFVVAIF
jgi:hypothetical protein